MTAAAASSSLYTVPSWRWRAVLAPAGVLGAWVICPKCGLPFSLAGAEILKNGKVLPRLECTVVGCDFAALARLDGWGLGAAEFKVERVA